MKKKKERKDNEQSGLKQPPAHWATMSEEWVFDSEDSLLKSVIRQYHRNLRYPGDAMKHFLQGQVYFSVEVDRNGVFKNFNTYNQKPTTNDIKDIVVVGFTPVAVTEENLRASEAKEIFSREVERATGRAKPVVHPEERTYYFRVIFKFDKQQNSKTVEFTNTQSFEKKRCSFCFS